MSGSSSSESSQPFSFGRPRDLLAEKNYSEFLKLTRPTVFVFALFSPSDLSSEEAIDLNQWRFAVLNLQVMAYWRKASINFKTLELFGGFVSFSELGRLV